MKALLLIPAPSGSQNSVNRLRIASLAELLSTEFRITIASEPFEIPGGDDLEWTPFDGERIAKNLQSFDAVLLQNRALALCPFLLSSMKPVIVDMADPLLLDPPPASHSDLTGELASLHRALSRGDLFICSQGSAENLLTGMLIGSGRINPDTYGKEKDLEKLLLPVPYLLPLSKSAAAEQGPDHLSNNKLRLLWVGPASDNRYDRVQKDLDLHPVQWFSEEDPDSVAPLVREISDSRTGSHAWDAVVLGDSGYLKWRYSPHPFLEDLLLKRVPVVLDRNACLIQGKDFESYLSLADIRDARSITQALQSILAPGGDRPLQRASRLTEDSGTRLERCRQRLLEQMTRLLLEQPQRSKRRTAGIRFRLNEPAASKSKPFADRKEPIRLLLIKAEPVGQKLAGIGMRSVELARTLSETFKVTLAAPGTSWHDPLPFKLADYEREPVSELVRKADIVMTDPECFSHLPELRRAEGLLSLDLCCPNILENLEHDHGGDQARRWLIYLANLRILYTAFQEGAHFFCAGQSQVDLWSAFLGLLGRLTPRHRGEPVDQRPPVSIVPYGMPSEDAPVQSGGLRSRIASLSPDDRVLLWNGGLWPWFDPQTLLQAMAVLSKTRQDIKLVFMGTRKPGGSPALHAVADRVKDMSRRWGLLDRTVFFLDWIEYNERHRCLQDADLALCTHKAGLETQFSFRTRFLDCLWCRLPIVITEGGIVSDLVERHGLGATVPAGQSDALASIIIELLDSPEKIRAAKDKAKNIAPRFTWSKTSKALHDLPESALKVQPAIMSVHFPYDRLRRSWFYLRKHGPVTFLQHLAAYLRRS
ncbi:glycosyltransferase family 4 protein [Acidobacteriota bacterium]